MSAAHRRRAGGVVSRERDEWQARAELAEARLAKVEALLAERSVYAFRTGEPYVRVSLVRAALAAPEDGQR
jgi:hypothetical protein